MSTHATPAHQPARRQVPRCRRGPGRPPLRSRAQPGTGSGRGGVAALPHRPRALRVGADRPRPAARAPNVRLGLRATRDRCTREVRGDDASRCEGRRVPGARQARRTRPRPPSPSSCTSPATSEDINNLAYAPHRAGCGARGLDAEAADGDRPDPGPRGRPSRRRHARAHPRPARHPDDGRQGVRGVRAPAGPDRGPDRRHPGARQVQWRDRHLRGAPRGRPRAGLAGDLPGVRRPRSGSAGIR